jgi:hypothetical protein
MKFTLLCILHSRHKSIHAQNQMGESATTCISASPGYAKKTARASHSLVFLLRQTSAQNQSEGSPTAVSRMIESLQHELDLFGLKIRGIANFTAEEIERYDFTGKSIALVGNVGSSYWQSFASSPEFSDGLGGPLDRWSQRIAEKMELKLNLEPVYPFTGPPYYPFQQWAGRAEPLFSSPLGLVIHPQFGLWHSYRFGIILPDLFDTNPAVETSPCLDCTDQPCLDSCPVSAFSVEGYDVEGCAAYLNSDPAAVCHQQGCLARLACPVGTSYRYETNQHLFHLRAFLQARPAADCTAVNPIK